MHGPQVQQLSWNQSFKIVFKKRVRRDGFYFNQWQSTDRTSLITRCVTTEEYKDLLIEVIDKLTVHSFIAKCQGEYLKQCKDNLLHDECIWLGDFSENYEFVVQDEVQSYHWKRNNVLFIQLCYIIKMRKINKNKNHFASFLMIWNMIHVLYMLHSNI